MEAFLNIAEISGISPILLIMLGIWSLAWKGLALWRSATLGHKKWFIIILIINTVGILEIIYLFAISRKYQVEVIEEK